MTKKTRPQDFKPAAEPGKTGYDLPVMRFDDFKKSVESLPESENMIEEILPKNETLLVAGEPWEGKSLELQRLANCFGSGTSYHGLKVNKCQCLYITWEGSSKGLIKRLESTSITADPKPNFQPYIKLLSNRVEINSDVGYQTFRDLLDECNDIGKVEVVLIDSAPYTIGGNAAKDMVINEWWDKLQEIIRDYDITPIFSWELNKLIFDARLKENTFTLERLKTAHTTAYKVNSVLAIGELKNQVKGKWIVVGHRIVVLKAKDSPAFEPLSVELSPLLTWEGQHWEHDKGKDVWKAVAD